MGFVADTVELWQKLNLYSYLEEYLSIVYFSSKSILQKLVIACIWKTQENLGKKEWH